MRRLRVAGKNAWAVWSYHKKHGFQQPSRTAVTHHFVMPPAEDGPGYSSWMGPPAPGPSGSFASAEQHLLNQVPDFGSFHGHENEISGPFPALPSVGPSAKSSRPQGSTGGSSSQPPRGVRHPRQPHSPRQRRALLQCPVPKAPPARPLVAGSYSRPSSPEAAEGLRRVLHSVRQRVLRFHSRARQRPRN